MPPVLEVVEGETGNWLHVLHRVKSGRDVFLVCNQNHQGAARNSSSAPRRKGHPRYGTRCATRSRPCRASATARTTEFSLALEPMESVLLVFQDKRRNLPPRGGAHDAAARNPAARRPSRSEQDGAAKLVVVKATYGVPGDAQRSRDVRERLQK